MNEFVFPSVLMLAIISVVELVLIVFLIGLTTSLKCDLARLRPVRAWWPDHVPAPEPTNDDRVNSDVLNLADAERDWNKDIRRGKPRGEKKQRKRGTKAGAAVI